MGLHCGACWTPRWLRNGICLLQGVLLASLHVAITCHATVHPGDHHPLGQLRLSIGHLGVRPALTASRGR